MNFTYLHNIPLRLDKFILQQLPAYSRTQIHKMTISVNGEVVKWGYKLQLGDSIVVHDQPAKQQPIDVKPANITLDIVDEDEHIIIINKPAGMVTHPAVGNYDNTLVNALLYHYDREALSDINLGRFGIVHRLDKDTSGLLVVAKHNQVHQHLAKQFAERTIIRNYQALVYGLPIPSCGEIIKHITRHPMQRKQMTVSHDQTIGRYAHTKYQTSASFADGKYSLVEYKLLTGRTHQIRVHSLYAKFPILGDPVYNTVASSNNSAHRYFANKQALCAYCLGFHYLGRDYYYQIPLPQNMQEFMKMY